VALAKNRDNNVSKNLLSRTTPGAKGRQQMGETFWHYRPGGKENLEVHDIKTQAKVCRVGIQKGNETAGVPGTWEVESDSTLQTACFTVKLKRKKIFLGNENLCQCHAGGRSHRCRAGGKPGGIKGGSEGRQRGRP